MKLFIIVRQGRLVMQMDFRLTPFGTSHLFECRGVSFSKYLYPARALFRFTEIPDAEIDFLIDLPLSAFSFPLVLEHFWASPGILY